jgi:hypothetical protein
MVSIYTTIAVAGNFDSGSSKPKAVGWYDFQNVAKRNFQHACFQFMEAVIALSQDVQTEIDFTGRENYHLVKVAMSELFS